MQNPPLNKGKFEQNSSHKPGSQFSFSSALAKSLRMPRARYTRTHTHTRPSPCSIAVPEESPFPTSSRALSALPAPRWHHYPSGLGWVGRARLHRPPCTPRTVTRCRAVQSSRSLLSPCGRSQKAITFAPTAGDKLETDKCSPWKQQLDVLSNHCPRRASRHFQPGALRLL